MKVTMNILVIIMDISFKNTKSIKKIKEIIIQVRKKNFCTNFNLVRSKYWVLFIKVKYILICFRYL